MRYLERRALLSPADVERIGRAYGNEAVKITRGWTAAVEATVQAEIQNIAAEGLHVREGTKRIGEALARAGVSDARPWLVETMYRTQVSLAYSAGRWQANQHPAIQEILWGFEYVTAGDDRVRANHVALEGVTLPKDSPEWDRIAPPNGFSCRCSLAEVYDQGEVSPVPATAVVDDIEVAPVPDKGWEFNPAKILN